MVVWNHVYRNGKEALLTAVSTNTKANDAIPYARLRGLEDTVLYRCIENGQEYSGAVLRTIGMPLPMEPGEYHAYRYHFVRNIENC